MTRGWLALGLVGVAALSGCTSKPAPLPTLPPLTASATPSGGASSPSTSPSSTPTPSDTPASVTPTATDTPSGSATPIPGLHPPAGNSTDAALATAKAYVYSLFAIDFDLDPRALKLVTAPSCPCQADALAEFKRMSAAHERVVGGSLPRNLTATLIDRASDHARVAVSYDVAGGTQVNDKGAVTQVLKPQHLSFKAYLEYRNARWQIVETS